MRGLIRDGERYIRCEDITLSIPMRTPGSHPDQPSVQNNWVQSHQNGRHPLIIEIDMKLRMVRVAHEGKDSEKQWGEFFTPLTNVRDFRVWRGKTEESVASADKPAK